MKKIYLLVFFSILFLSTNQAIAFPFGFTDIVNDQEDFSQYYSGHVSEDGSKILFTITNNGPQDSFIGAVYFNFNPQDLLTNGAFSLDDSVGTVQFVDFNNDNFNLPQGQNISFDADWGQERDVPNNNKLGVDVGETVAFLFDGSFEAVREAINSGNLRIGIHVQGLDTIPGSDSYVNGNPVPEPATMALFGIGLIGIAGLSRRIKE